MTSVAEPLPLANLHLPGYTLTECIYQGTRTRVYRAIATATQQAVVIKILAQEYPSFSELVQFRNQYTIAKNLPIEGIIRPLSLDIWGNGYAFIMEDVGGIDLGQYAQQHPLSLMTCLDIASQLAVILHELHQHRVIHKDIKPANILIHPETKRIKLIDFSIASLLPKETQALQNPQSLEGTLAYMSPEQTGRMNRAIDYRTDFYALGVTVYQLLTGQLPCASNDPLELIHCHIALPPTAINAVNPEVPAMVVAMVAKLMAKNAEDRYQSALGLKYDLEQCLTQWRDQGSIADFKLGQRDLSDRFIIPEKLYGRDADVQTLLEAFEQVSQGALELMLIAGFSGIGKTALVNEVHKPITRQHGYFIKGKFDQFNRNIPFSAFVQAFRDLVGQLLSESDSALATWKTKLLTALGNNGQVLMEVIPELEHIIGEQPAVVDLSGTAAQNRFNQLFQTFIATFTTVDHPLVIFLDDLQWADSASLNLLNLLMTEAGMGYLLILGAYRDNEVFPAHPLTLMLEDIKQHQVNIRTFTLKPLVANHIHHLIADTLLCSTERATPLAELVYQKTQGNPFFTTQFLYGLYEDNLITFDSIAGYWQCNLTQIQQSALTDDVIEFVLRRLQKLPTTTQAILKLAACIGNQFDLNMLAIVCDRPQHEIASDLWQSLQDGLVIPENETYKFFQGDSCEIEDTVPNIRVGYRFLHDRVQQAAYALIPEEDKPLIHLKTGQFLLAQWTSQKHKSEIFKIVNNLNKGIELIDNERQRQQLARLNLEAGQQAKSSIAYVEAVAYIEQGIRLLLPQGWTTQYTLMLELYSELVEVQFFRGDFESVETISATILDHFRNTADALPIYIVKLSSDLARGEMVAGFNLGLNVLKSLGLPILTAVDENKIQQKRHQTLTAFKAKTIQDLIDLPQNHDPQFLRIQDLLTVMVGYAYKFKPELLSLIIGEQIALLMRHGNIPASASIYALYGMLLCGSEDFESGFWAGEVALAMIEAFPTKQFEMRVRNLIYSYIMPWKQLLRTSISPLKQGFAIGLEVGDIEYTSYGINHYIQFLYFAGADLATIDNESILYCDILKNYRQEGILAGVKIFHQTILNLIHVSDTPWQLDGESFQESNYVADWQKNHLEYFLCALYINKLVLSVLFNNPAVGLNYATIAHDSYKGLTGEFQLSYFHCYRALAHLAVLSPLSSSEEQSHGLTQVAIDLVKLEQFASFAPMNFQHQVELVKAERHRVIGQRLEAMETYDRAIKLAKVHGYVQEEAFANELAAKLYLDWDKEKVAAGYMQEAYYSYARWGAKAKTVDLETRYPKLLRPILQSLGSSGDMLATLTTLATPITSVHSSTYHRSSLTSLNQTLDFASILKASQALSSTIQLGALLRQLTQLILQTSGSDYCTLILPDESGEWQMRAIATPEKAKLHTEPLANNPNLPVKLIQYVKNIREAIVVNDLKTDLPIVDDYLRQQQPKSLLCLPILNQGHLIGIFYLRNRLTSGVFTANQILVLNFLCTQAAISLENARLYQQEQRKSQEIAQREAEYRSIFESVNDGLCIFDLATGQAVAVNPRLEQIHGYSAKEWLTLQPDDFIHASYLHEFVNFLDALNRGEEFYTQATGLHKDGHSFEIEVKAVPFIYKGKPHGLTVFRDISGRKNAESALRENELKFRNLLSNLDGVVYRCHNDSDWTMEFISDAIIRLSGYPVSDFIGSKERTYPSIMHPDDIIPISDVVCQRLDQHQTFVVEYRIIRRDGSIRWVTETGKGIVNEAGDVSHIEGVILDIDDRKQAEEIVLQKSHDLEQALIELQHTQLHLVQSEKMSALGGLVAGVAHEINNPVGCILGNVRATQGYINDLLGLLNLYAEQFPKPGPDIEDELDTVDLDFVRGDLPQLMRAMKDSGDRIKSISKSLRTFSRADTETKQIFNLHEGIESTVLILRHRLKANKQRPTINVVREYGDIPEIACFPGQLNQVFMNILANAVEALDEASQQRSFADLEAHPQRIMIRTESNQQQVTITIADNGPGIPEAIKTKIFDYLFTTKGVGNGTGLGLAISHQIVVDTHGGSLDVQSDMEQGTEFCIRLPI